MISWLCVSMWNWLLLQMQNWASTRVHWHSQQERHPKNRTIVSKATTTKSNLWWKKLLDGLTPITCERCSSSITRKWAGDYTSLLFSNEEVANLERRKVIRAMRHDVPNPLLVATSWAPMQFMGLTMCGWDGIDWVKKIGQVLASKEVNTYYLT